MVNMNMMVDPANYETLYTGMRSLDRHDLV